MTQKILEIDALLNEWYNAQQQAALWVEKERQLRQQIFSQAFPEPVVGTNKVRVGHGKAVVGTYKMNYTVDRPLLLNMMQQPNVAPIVNEVISHKPEVKDGAYRKLADQDRLLIAPAITEKPGMPSIEIKDAAKLRW